MNAPCDKHGDRGSTVYICFNCQCVTSESGSCANCRDNEIGEYGCSLCVEGKQQ